MNIWTLNNLLVRDLIPWTIETVDTIRVANYVKAAKLIYTPRAENNEMSGPHLTAAWLAATVANAEWMQPLSRILARGHAARVSNRKKSLAKVWHPIARIGEKTEFEAFALDTVSQLCVLRRRSQWYESGYSSGVGCVPGCVHAYPSSRGSIHETCQPPAPPAHNMQFLQLGSSPLLLHMFCSHTLHYYSWNQYNFHLTGVVSWRINSRPNSGSLGGKELGRS